VLTLVDSCKKEKSMTRENPKQLTVPFGKYKGKPVEILLQDESYAKWLTGQDWFQQKFQNIYTLIIHNYHAEPIDTPEHNKMQVKFLNDIHKLKLAFIVSDYRLFEFNNTHFKETAPKFLKDLKERGVKLQEVIDEFNKIKGGNLLKISKVEFEQKGLDVKYEISYGYSIGVSEGTYQRARAIFDRFWENKIYLEMRIELKPFIGDDFPNVLRQMKTSKASILIIDEYSGTGVSFEEFKHFFTSQGFRVFTEREIEQINLPEYDDVLKFDENIFSYIFI
jgi:uncharacterized protein (DUF3820 family)